MVSVHFEEFYASLDSGRGGWQEGLVGHAVVPAGRDSQAGYTLVSDHPVIVENLGTEKRFQGPELLQVHNLVSGMSVMIIGGPSLRFGILGAHTTKQRKFTEDDVNFLKAVANLLALKAARTVAEVARPATTGA